MTFPIQTFSTHVPGFPILLHYFGKSCDIMRKNSWPPFHRQDAIWPVVTRSLRPTLVFWICRLPCSSRENRGSFPARLAPFFLQVTVGSGSPDAWHLSSDTPPSTCVWLDGPWRMMGGGRSFKAEDNNQDMGVIFFPFFFFFLNTHSQHCNFHVMVLAWNNKSLSG